MKVKIYFLILIFVMSIGCLFLVNNNLSNTNANLNNQLQQQEQTYSGKIDELTVYQEKLVERISLLEENYSKLQTAYDELKAAYDQYILDSTLEREQIQVTVVDLRETIAVLEQNADVDAETITALRTEVTALETSLENQTTTANELQATVTQQEATIAELNTTIDALIDELNSDLKSIQLEKFQQIFSGGEIVSLTADDLGDVAQIRPYAFYNCTNIETIELPSTCETIGSNAFYGNTGLKNVSAINVKDVNAAAFQGCNNLEYANFSSALNIGNTAFSGCNVLIDFRISNPLTIGNSAFSGCPITEFNFGNQLTTIGTGAFTNARFTNVNLPNTLTTIGSSAFKGSSIVNLVIPDSVTSLSAQTFDGCVKLEKIEMPSTSTFGSLTLQTMLSRRYTSSSQASYTSYYADCYMYAKSYNEYFLIPKTLKEIKFVSGNVISYDFSGFSSLTKIDISNCVISSGSYLFSGCSNLENLILPEGDITLYEYMFNNCLKLTDLKIPYNITEIPAGVFKKTGITEINIPDTIINIGADAFYGTSITNVEIPNSVTTIGNYAFSSTLITNLVIPNSVTTVGEYAFEKCYSLENVTFSTSMTTISRSMFSYCNKLKTIKIPSNITEISHMAFEGCGLENVELSEGLLTIGNYAFRHHNLESLVIPSSVTKIGVCVAGRNSGESTFKSIYIPDLTAIDFDTMRSDTTFGFGDSLVQNCATAVIYTGSAELPDNAKPYWNCRLSISDFAPVNYGYTYEQYLEAISA